MLRRSRHRIGRDEDAVAAERGYSREAGNLAFHLNVGALLLGVTINALLQFRGDVVVIAGQGFCNNLTQYDDATAGALVVASGLLLVITRDPGRACAGLPHRHRPPRR